MFSLIWAKFVFSCHSSTIQRVIWHLNTLVDRPRAWCVCVEKFHPFKCEQHGKYTPPCLLLFAIGFHDVFQSHSLSSLIQVHSPASPLKSRIKIVMISSYCNNPHGLGLSSQLSRPKVFRKWGTPYWHGPTHEMNMNKLQTCLWRPRSVRFVRGLTITFQFH